LPTSLIRSEAALISDFACRLITLVTYTPFTRSSKHRAGSSS